MEIKDIKELARAYSWEDLGQQKMSSMLSFKKDSYRINIYTTTMSVTRQRITSDFSERRCDSFKNVDTLDKLEKIYDI